MSIPFSDRINLSEVVEFTRKSEFSFLRFFEEARREEKPLSEDDDHSCLGGG
jgi:hypothetical protein